MTYPVLEQELIHCLTTRGHSAPFYNLVHTCVSSFYLFSFVFLSCISFLILLSIISPVLLIHLQFLTKVCALDWGDVADVSLDEKVEVWDDNERWCQTGPWVVLHNQVVTLKLPVGVTALLHFGEGVAVDSKLTSHYAYRESENAFLHWVSVLYNIHYSLLRLKSV